jgi:type IV fimbrial biogenesis protein FimT
MVVIVVAAIGITLAVPSFRDLIERKAVGGAAEAVYEQLQIARSQAIKRSKPILVDFNIDGTSWAVGITDKTAGCDAELTSGNTCTISDYNNDGIANDQMLMRVQGIDYKNITMSLETAFASAGTLTGECVTVAPAGTACFDYVRGLARAGSYVFESANYKLQVEVTMLGNVNICIPTDEKKIVGYDDC